MVDLHGCASEAFLSCLLFHLKMPTVLSLNFNHLFYKPTIVKCKSLFFFAFIKKTSKYVINHSFHICKQLIVEIKEHCTHDGIKKD